MDLNNILLILLGFVVGYIAALFTLIIKVVLKSNSIDNDNDNDDYIFINTEDYSSVEDFIEFLEGLPISDENKQKMLDQYVKNKKEPGKGSFLF